MVSNINQFLRCYSFTYRSYISLVRKVTTDLCYRSYISLIRKLTTDLYVKPTDSHQYLVSLSCHPYHCKKEIPYNQAFCLIRICSDPKSFDG